MSLKTFSFKNIHIAFFLAGSSVSKIYVERAVEEGALVIDNTNAFRMKEDVFLVVPQVNGDLLKNHSRRGIIANPNCATIPITRALRPIVQNYGLRKVIVSTYQAASGAGLTGIKELQEDIKLALDNLLPYRAYNKFPVPLGFNLIPSIDVLLDDNFTLEEQKIMQETRKIFESPSLDISATAVRVPINNCHSSSVYFECERRIDYDNLISLLKKEPEIKVYEAPDYPTPRFIDELNFVHVGRIRVDTRHQNCGWLWVVSDNLRVGAALNAIQIAETLIGG